MEGKRRSGGAQGVSNGEEGKVNWRRHLRKEKEGGRLTLLLLLRTRYKLCSAERRNECAKEPIGRKGFCLSDFFH